MSPREPAQILDVSRLKCPARQLPDNAGVVLPGIEALPASEGNDETLKRCRLARRAPFVVLGLERLEAVLHVRIDDDRSLVDLNARSRRYVSR